MIDLVGLRMAAAIVAAVPGTSCRLLLEDASTVVVAGTCADVDRVPAAQFRRLVADAARAAGPLPPASAWLEHVAAVRLDGDTCPPALHRVDVDGTPVWCFATTMRPSTTAAVVAEALDQLEPSVRGVLEVDDLQLVPDDLLGVTLVCCLDDEVEGCARSAMSQVAGSCLVAELLAASPLGSAPA